MKWLDAEGNQDWDAYAQEEYERREGLYFSEEDKKLIVLMQKYDEARQLLGKENDIEALWRTITAADAMRSQLGMMP